MRTIFLTVFVLAAAGAALADTTADTYAAALAAGDHAAITHTQSFLAPPYCYDLNLWHGVVVETADNGRVAKPRYPFTNQDMTCLPVRQLYDRAGIAAMEAAAADELDLIRRLHDWANGRWGHIQPMPYPSWSANEILDKVETGDAFWCTFKASLFVQACSAAGFTARILGINPKDSAAHTVTEVYSNQFRKWMLVDPWLNVIYMRDGIPLSALEMRDARPGLAGVELWFGEHGKGMERWDVRFGKKDRIASANARIPIQDDPQRGLSNMYDDVRIVMRNDHTQHPQQAENRYVDGFMVPYNARGGEWWGPQLKWTDAISMPQLTCANTGDLDDFEWPLNEVRVDLEMVSPPRATVELDVRFETMTPCFDHYRMSVDGAVIETAADIYRWRLHAGANSLTVASVNALGRSGHPSEFVLTWDPASVKDFEEVAVRTPNPGFETAADAKAFRPAGWQTITSNPLGAGTFELDKKVHHSGAASLKAVPALDPKTGTVYAFIVRSENITVNPASDVVYTIWLRADAPDTPVDIALLEATYKGSGTYVKRVTVGTGWQEYRLPCRLHNELREAYVGFKVYRGTVWADDALLEEVR